jgi:hypothetical protein
MRPTISPRVHIGEVIRNAVVFNPETTQDILMNSDLLIEGIALLQYVEGRNTEDIDLIMAVSALENLPELILESRDGDFARGKFGNLKVDVLLTSNPLFDAVRNHHTTSKRFVEQEIVCVTVEGLILLKLYALPSLYRQGNFTRVGLYENDVATLIHIHKPPLPSILSELTKYLDASDLKQVKQIVDEIQQRLKRFDGRG